MEAAENGYYGANTKVDWSQQVEVTNETTLVAAGWFTRSELADEVVYPTLLMDYEWSQLWQKEPLISLT